MRCPARGLLLLACSALLVACGGGSGKRENIEPPTELADFSPTLDIQQIWSRNVGKGEDKAGLRQRPAIGDGRVYSSDLKGRVTALDAGSGSELWSVEFEGLRFGGAPGLGESTLALGTLDGEVLALNPDTGAERWRETVSSEVISAPAIGAGVVVVRANDGRVFGFDLIDGERRWVFDRGLPSLTLRGNCPPLIAEGAVFIGYDTGEVVALDLTDGRQLWEQTVAEGEGRTELERMVDVDGEMQFDQGQLFATSYRGNAAAIDAASARPLWNREMSSYGGLALAGNALIVSDDEGVVWSLDRTSGAAFWRQEGLRHRWLSTPAIHEGHVLVGDVEGYVHWLRLQDGSLAARDRVGKDPIVATPQVVDGTAFVQDRDGELAAFRRR